MNTYEKPGGEGYTRDTSDPSIHNYASVRGGCEGKLGRHRNSL